MLLCWNGVIPREIYMMSNCDEPIHMKVVIVWPWNKYLYSMGMSWETDKRRILSYLEAVLHHTGNSCGLTKTPTYFLECTQICWVQSHSFWFKILLSFSGKWTSGLCTHPIAPYLLTSPWPFLGLRGPASLRNTDPV